MSKYMDISGHRFWHITAIKFLHIDQKLKSAVWLFRCDCGSEFSYPATFVKRGRKKSCGCQTLKAGTNSEETPVKLKATELTEYNIWCSIKQRSENHNGFHPNYSSIRMCDRWSNSFKNFLDDMGYRPGPEYSIDRINNKGDYTPENCRWATQDEQHENRDNTIKIDINGKERTIAQLSKESGLSYAVIYNRIKRGWTQEKVISPTRNRK